LGENTQIGSSVLELFPAHEHTRLKALYDSMLRGEPAERQHLEMVSPNGNLQHYEVTYYLLNAQPDSSTRIAMFMRNVTDLYETQRKQREDAEHALHQTKEQFYKTANTVPGMIYKIVFHPDGSVSYPYVSEGCRALYGVNPEDVMRDASILTKMWHPDDIGEYMRRVEECRRTLKPFDMECRIVLPDGTIKWLRVNSVPEPQTNGSLCFYGIRTDITAQKQTEAILNQQRIQMNAAADLAKLAFYESQTQTLFLNDRYFALLGTTAEQEGGYTMSVEKYLGKFVLPEDVPVMLQHMRNVLSNPTLMRGETMYRIRRLDNGQIRYLKAIFNVERNAEGAPVRLFGPIQDVTEQEEALLALRQQQLQMNAAADLAKLAFYESQTQTLFLNDRYFALLGTTAEQEGGYTMSVEKYLGKFVLPEDVPVMLQHMRNVLSNPTLMRGETMYRIRRLDNGQIRYLKAIFNVERNAEGVPARLLDRFKM
jgi:PAS domain S-box